jgi:uncharacterized cupredoxin-like copper-binding protein
VKSVANCCGSHTDASYHGVQAGEEPMKATLVAAIATAAVASAAPFAQAGSQPAVTRSANASVLLKRVSVAASEFKFVLSAKSAKRGVVVFRVKNVGKIKHDFQISGRKTRMLDPGQSATLRVAFLRKGHYPYKCTVPGHAAAGMKGVFTIT